MKRFFGIFRNGGNFSKVIGVLVVFILLMTIIFPIIIMGLWAFVDPQEGWYYPHLLPPKLSLYWWKDVFSLGGLGKAILLSFIIAPLSTLGCAIFSIPTAYAIGRRKVSKKLIPFLNLLILAPIIIPRSAVGISLAAVFGKIGLWQTIPGIILAHMVIFIPYMTRTTIAAFESIPQDVIDASKNLGANTFQLLWKVLIPLVTPGILAGAVFTFIYSIEEFELAFIIGSPTYQTLPVVLFSFLGYSFIRTKAAVLSLIILIPTMGLLMIAEKFLKNEYVGAGFGKIN